MLSASARQPLGRIVEILVGVDAQAAQPDFGVVSAGEEPDLRVVGVVVAQAGGEPRARVVERRGDEAASGRGPLGDSSLGFVLQGLKFRRQRLVVAGSAGSGPAGARSAAGPNEMPTSFIETPTPGAGKKRPTWTWSFRCLPTCGEST